MGEPKGPRVDLPDELMSELEDAGETTYEEDPASAASGGSEDGTTADDGGAADVNPGTASSADVEALNDKMLRLAAEYENFKRRALRERQDVQKFANEGLVKELLATVDNLERALGHAQAGGDAEATAGSLLEGVELTYRSLMQSLDKFGVQVVDAAGEVFNPEFHEAIRQVPSDDVESGHVAEVYQKGYRLHDRLLRPALVAVSSGKGD